MFAHNQFALMVGMFAHQFALMDSLSQSKDFILSSKCWLKLWLFSIYICEMLTSYLIGMMSISSESETQ
jgi:hypothetical protein